MSYQATDWLSVGAGLNAMYGYLNTRMAVNNAVGPDGQMSLKDGTWGFGADVGILIQAGERTRFGLGAQYQLSESVNVGAASTLGWGGDMSVDQGSDQSLRGRVSGRYNDTWYSFTRLNLTWKS